MEPLLERLLRSLGGSEAIFLEACFGRLPYGNFFAKAASKKSRAPSGTSGRSQPKPRPRAIVISLRARILKACAPCAVKICAVCPMFARVVQAADPSKCPRAHEAKNAISGQPSGAPRRRWKPGQEQHPGPENQDRPHMLNLRYKDFYDT